MVFLHAVPVGHGGSDIDHVVIGPAAFTRSTRNIILPSEDLGWR